MADQSKPKRQTAGTVPAPTTAPDPAAEWRAIERAYFQNEFLPTSDPYIVEAIAMIEKPKKATGVLPNVWGHPIDASVFDRR